MKTKATVAKLDEIIMRMYAGYATRRVPINTSGVHPQEAARRRLDALRDLMRMEMPERFNDITDAPHNYSWGAIGRPALNMAYNSVGAPSGVNSHAECLYLIVSIANPQELEHFGADEIGDTDGDGFPEFVDAWGNPIYFLRWAPGFIDSDIQPPPGIATTDPRFKHDPFDTHGLYPARWKLVPLIFSAGPDGRVDISQGGLINHGLEMGQNVSYSGDPYNVNIGAPNTVRGERRHDNIHNHRLDVR
jgi:hypothetical protein